MSRGVNKAFLIGNVGQSPEIRTTPSGTKVAKVSLATNRTWTDRNGQKQEDVQWHRLTFWGKLADIVEQYVGKGDRLYVEGRIEYSTTEGEDGVTRYWTDINVSELVMLGGAEGERYDADSEKAKMGGPHPPNAGGSLSQPDDDLPFSRMEWL